MEYFMKNLAQWIEEEACGEPIEAVVIGGMGWDGDYNSEGVPNYKDQKKFIVLPWQEARPMLDYSFDTGYDAGRMSFRI